MTSFSMFKKSVSFALAAMLPLALSRLVVYGPNELKDKFEYSGKKIFLVYLYYTEFKIPASFANFGNIPYG